MTACASLKKGRGARGLLAPFLVMLPGGERVERERVAGRVEEAKSSKSSSCSPTSPSVSQDGSASLVSMAQQKVSKDCPARKSPAQV
jgi:hypothetical protein